MALTNAGVERSFKILLIWLPSFLAQLREVAHNAIHEARHQGVASMDLLACLILDQVSFDILVNHSRDEGLVRHAFFHGFFLDAF